MNAIEKIVHEGFTIELFYDELAHEDSPRDWDNCGVLAQLSDRFLQPDKADSRADALIEAWDRYNRDTDKVERYARAYLNAVAVEWWDDPRSESRIVGIIDRETATEERLPDPSATLKGELRTYAQWANGEVYLWTVTDPDGEFVDSCGGYIGDPEDAAMFDATRTINAEIDDRHARRVEMYRRLVNNA